MQGIFEVRHRRPGTVRVPPVRRRFLGPDLLKRMAASTDPLLQESGYATSIATSEAFGRRMSGPAASRGGSAVSSAKVRQVYDMAGTVDPLPGQLVRDETDPEHADDIVNLAYDQTGTALDFLRDVMGRRSIDGRGYPLRSSVHFGRTYSNAFWDGERIIFGDGDGTYFRPFVHAIDIVAHEVAHGVISFTSDLHYRGEAGALHESFCDVMGLMTRQWAEKADPSLDDWMVGGGALDRSLGIGGIRSLTEMPAYKDHPLLGSDEQPKHMRDFVRTVEDRHGVHANAGIPSHAFHLAARELGGAPWESAGKIWFDTFLELEKDASFVDAADATIAKCETRHGKDSLERKAFSAAWRAVGIL